ncbi:2-keto-4-pentenoate hydratase [Microbacterium sp. NPDC090281]|uniref:2-keto-4-pentenoate hydratase n=1 Tax=Microbacterium sp. NPDC090281 TaxID=3364208 RepID=UPI0037FE88F2
MTSEFHIGDFARRLRTARSELRAIDHLSTQQPNLSLDDAYLIQSEIRRLDVESGAVIRGHKIGATSLAIQEMFNISHPDSGYITDRMLLADGDELELSLLISPLLEGEIAFIMDEDLAGHRVDEGDVLAAASTVMPAFEVLDTRFRDWELTIVDTVADNASCALVVCGAPVSHLGMDLASVRLEFDTPEEKLTATGAVVMGHPAEAVAHLVRLLAERGEGLNAGEIILAGAWTRAVPIAEGRTYRADFGGIGSVSLRVSDNQAN